MLKCQAVTRHYIKNLIVKFNPLTDGWVFFLGAALAFNLGILLKASVQQVSICFQTLSLAYFAMLMIFLFKNRQQIKSGFVLTCLAVFLFFLFRGAYLVYPNDGWEYFRLITQWQNKVDLTNTGYLPNRYILDPPRYSFLLYWAHLQYLPRTWWRFGLDLISAGTITLVFVQIYELTRFFVTDRKQALWMAIFALVFTGIFNMSYFYSLALSSNILSFVFFYRALISLFRLWNKKWNEIPVLILLSVLMYYTHVQGLLLLAVAVFSLMFHSLFYVGEYKKLRWILISLVSLTSMLILYLHFDDFLSGWESWSDAYLFTLGQPAILALIVGFFVRKNMKFLWSLSIAPVLLLLVPAFSFPLFKYILPHPVLGHRILYLLPTGFLMQQVLHHFLKRTRREFLWMVFFLILFSVNPKRPYCGRLESLVAPVPPELTLQTLEPTAFWLEKNRPDVLKKCRYATDQVTDFMLTTYFGWELHNPRNSHLDQQFELAFKNVEKGEGCGILIRDWTQPHEFPESRMNNELHEWSPELGSPDLMTTSVMKDVATELIKKGWSKTMLPSGYILIERNTMDNG